MLSDIPSYRELWDGAACFFRSDDADDLRDKWSWLLANEVERRDLAHRARERAAACYTSRRMAEDYLDVYSSLSQAVAA